MSRASARRSTGDRANLYSQITDRIIAELEAGRLPWVQPWGTDQARTAVGLPRNAGSGRPYSGINVLILWGAVIERGYSGQGWLTFRQAKALGGSVRKGERGTTVVYADKFVPEDERRRASEKGEDPQAIPFLKRFTVFNTDQCERTSTARGHRHHRAAGPRGSDPAPRRGADRRHPGGFSHRRQPRLLQPPE